MVSHACRTALESPNPRPSSLPRLPAHSGHHASDRHHGSHTAHEEAWRPHTRGAVLRCNAPAGQGTVHCVGEWSRDGEGQGGLHRVRVSGAGMEGMLHDSIGAWIPRADALGFQRRPAAHKGE